MRELQSRQKMKRRLYSMPMLGLLLVLVVLAGRGAHGVLKKRHESAARIVELKNKIATMEERKEELNHDIEKLDTKEGIDEEIKEKFSVSREGEMVAVIVDKRNSATTSPGSSPSWYQRLWASIRSLWQ